MTDRKWPSEIFLQHFATVFKSSRSHVAVLKPGTGQTWLTSGNHRQPEPSVDGWR